MYHSYHLFYLIAILNQYTHNSVDVKTFEVTFLSAMKLYNKYIGASWQCYETPAQAYTPLPLFIIFYWLCEWRVERERSLTIIPTYCPYYSVMIDKKSLQNPKNNNYSTIISALSFKNILRYFFKISHCTEGC